VPHESGRTSAIGDFGFLSNPKLLGQLEYLAPGAQQQARQQDAGVEKGELA
jgi:hypothetical protein